MDDKDKTIKMLAEALGAIVKEADKQVARNLTDTGAGFIAVNWMDLNAARRAMDYYAKESEVAHAERLLKIVEATSPCPEYAYSAEDDALLARALTAYLKTLRDEGK